jgi:flagellar assembly protein FliH
MNLRIIKKGSSRTAEISPFFFVEDQGTHHPEPYILPEAALKEPLPEVPEVPDLPEVVEEEPPPPPVDVEQLEKDAFERGYTEGRESGHKEGHEEGLTAGEKTADARVEELARRYADSLAEFAAYKDTLRAQVEGEVIRLALAVAKKIVHREIHIDPTIIHTLVRVALERVSGRSAVTVHLSQPDYEYMTSAHSDMSRVEGREIEFKSDNTLVQGDCVIQTEAGDIDARIEEEFNEVESAFFERL